MSYSSGKDNQAARRWAGRAVETEKRLGWPSNMVESRIEWLKHGWKPDNFTLKNI